MPDDSHRPLAAARQPMELARSRAVSVLSAHFVHDHLDVEELESRISRAIQARTESELIDLTSDLPALPPREAAQLGVYRVERTASVPEHRRVMNLFGDFVRSGAWTVPRRLMLLTGLGDVKLDFREARFGAEPVQLTVHQAAGDLELIVPPGVRVDVDVVKLIGDHHETADETSHSPGPDDVLIRISGTQLLGDIKVRTLLPGDPEKPSKRRRGRRD